MKLGRIISYRDETLLTRPIYARHEPAGGGNAACQNSVADSYFDQTCRDQSQPGARGWGVGIVLGSLKYDRCIRYYYIYAIATNAPPMHPITADVPPTPLDAKYTSLRTANNIPIPCPNCQQYSYSSYQEFRPQNRGAVLIPCFCRVWHYCL